MNGMPDQLRRLFFPEQYREVPQRRLIHNLLRSLHIISLGILIGGYFFAQPDERLTPWFAATLLTGAGLLLVDLYSSCILLFEVRGVSILIKLLLLSTLPLWPHDGQMILLALLVILSAFTSHSSKRFRHHNLMSPAFQQKYAIHDDHVNELDP